MTTHPVIRLGTLLLHLGHIEGRKKLQKLVHILQVSGAPFPERFVLSHYGAYSSELKAELDAMKSEDLVDERNMPLGSYSCFVLLPGEATRKLFTELQIDTDAPWLPLATRLNQETAQSLEGMSTVLYLQRMNWQGEGLRERFVALKPHLAANFDVFCQKVSDIPAHRSHSVSAAKDK